MLRVYAKSATLFLLSSFQEEKTLVGQHLLMASAALLVICGLLCFTASLPCCRSRRYHGTDLGLQKVKKRTVCTDVENADS